MIFTCKNFPGYYLTGCAVVSADTAAEAAAQLNATLRTENLPGAVTPEQMEPFHDGIDTVRVLFNGDY